MQRFSVTRQADNRRLHSQTVQAPVGDAATLARLAERWIRDQVGANPEPATLCSACDTELTPVGDAPTDYQFDNALWLKASGGYAMFVDDIDAGHSIVLCHDCAHQLCDSSAVMRAMLQPWSSHGHDFSEIEELIAAGHRGWDVDEFRLDDGPKLSAHIKSAHPEIPLDSDRPLRLEHHRAHRSGHVGHTHLAENPDPPPPSKQAR